MATRAASARRANWALDAKAAVAPVETNPGNCGLHLFLAASAAFQDYRKTR